RVVFGESIEAEGRLDLPSLRASCLATLSADSCYERFESSGLHYGASHRGLEEIHVGVDGAGNRVVLAKIVLPAIVESSRELYSLHPSVMDAALQASIGIVGDIVGEGNAYVPFAVDALDVLDRCPALGYAYVK